MWDSKHGNVVQNIFEMRALSNILLLLFGSPANAQDDEAEVSWFNACIVETVRD
jgi:hypothetical protein